MNDPVQSNEKYEKDAVNLYIAVAKLLITLAAVFIAATPPILQVISQRPYDKFWLIILALFLLISSVFCALWGFGAITGTLSIDKKYDANEKWTIYFFRSQQGLLWLGMLSFIFFGIFNLNRPLPQKDTIANKIEVVTKEAANAKAAASKAEAFAKEAEKYVKEARKILDEKNSQK